MSLINPKALETLQKHSVLDMKIPSNDRHEKILSKNSSMKMISTINKLIFF